MANESNYDERLSSVLNRMSALIDRERSRFFARKAGDLTAALIDRLYEDFKGTREIFSSEEDKDPAIRDAISALLSQTPNLVLVPKEVARFVRALLGDGKVLNLYAGFGEFLQQFGGGIGIERVPAVVERTRFLLELAGVEAEIINEDPLRWDSNETFDR